MAVVLRRAALSAGPRERVASLSSRDWLAFTDAAGGGFSDGPGRTLWEAPYSGSGPSAGTS